MVVLLLLWLGGGLVGEGAARPDADHIAEGAHQLALLVAAVAHFTGAGEDAFLR